MARAACAFRHGQPHICNRGLWLQPRLVRALHSRALGLAAVAVGRAGASVEAVALGEGNQRLAALRFLVQAQHGRAGRHVAAGPAHAGIAVLLEHRARAALLLAFRVQGLRELCQQGQKQQPNAHHPCGKLAADV